MENSTVVTNIQIEELERENMKIFCRTEKMPLKSIYGLDFDIFSDEHRSIRNAIEDIIPEFERWSACVKL